LENTHKLNSIAHPAQRQTRSELATDTSEMTSMLQRMPIEERRCE